MSSKMTLGCFLAVFLLAIFLIKISGSPLPFGWYVSYKKIINFVLLHLLVIGFLYFSRTKRCWDSLTYWQSGIPNSDAIDVIFYILRTTNIEICLGKIEAQYFCFEHLGKRIRIYFRKILFLPCLNQFKKGTLYCSKCLSFVMPKFRGGSIFLAWVGTCPTKIDAELARSSALNIGPGFCFCFYIGTKCWRSFSNDIIVNRKFFQPVEWELA